MSEPPQHQLDEVGCEREPASLLHDLLQLGESQFDVFAAIRQIIPKNIRKSLASSCQLARQLSRKAVLTVRLPGTQHPVQQDLAAVFPNATTLHLRLLSDGTEERSAIAAATVQLEYWASMAPGLLGQIRSLNVAILSSSLMDGDCYCELMGLLEKCTQLEELDVQALSASDELQVELEFSGALDPAAPSTLPNYQSTPGSTRSVAAANMAQQIISLKYHRMLDSASWPLHPFLTRLTILEPPAPFSTPLLPFAFAPHLRALLIDELPPTTLADSLPATLATAAASMPHLTHLQIPCFTTDDTPLTPVWSAIGLLTALRNLAFPHCGSRTSEATGFSIPSSWSNLTQLTRLHLIDYYDAMDVSSFAPMTSARDLILSCATGDLCTLSALHHLTKLVFSGPPAQQRLTWSKPDGTVNWGTRLAELDTELGAEPDTAVFAAVGRLTTLQVLRMTLQEEKAVSALRPLSALRSLTKLVLRDAVVTPQLCRLLSHMSALQRLYLMSPEPTTPEQPAVSPPPPTIPPITFPSLTLLRIDNDNEPPGLRALETFMMWTQAPRIQRVMCSKAPSNRLGIFPAHACPAWLSAFATGPPPRRPDDLAPPHPPNVKPNFLLYRNTDQDTLLERVPAEVLAQVGAVHLSMTPDVTAEGMSRYVNEVAAAARSTGLEVSELCLRTKVEPGVSGDMVRLCAATLGPWLKCVELLGCWRVADEDLRLVVELCPQLKWLRMLNAGSLSEKAFWPLLEHGRKLDVLHVSRSPRLTWRTLLPLAATAAVRLLRVEFCERAALNGSELFTLSYNVHDRCRVEVVQVGVEDVEVEGTKYEQDPVELEWGV